MECKRAGQRVEVKQQQNQVTAAGETWSTIENLNEADPLAWSYDRFLHCAVPELEKLNDSQQLLIRQILASQINPAASRASALP